MTGTRARDQDILHRIFEAQKTNPSDTALQALQKWDRPFDTTQMKAIFQKSPELENGYKIIINEATQKMRKLLSTEFLPLPAEPTQREQKINALKEQLEAIVEVIKVAVEKEINPGNKQPLTNEMSALIKKFCRAMLFNLPGRVIELNDTNMPVFNFMTTMKKVCFENNPSTVFEQHFQKNIAANFQKANDRTLTQLASYYQIGGATYFQENLKKVLANASQENINAVLTQIKKLENGRDQNQKNITDTFSQIDAIQKKIGELKHQLTDIEKKLAKNPNSTTLKQQKSDAENALKKSQERDLPRQKTELTAHLNEGKLLSDIDRMGLKVTLEIALNKPCNDAITNYFKNSEAARNVSEFDKKGQDCIQRMADALQEAYKKSPNRDISEFQALCRIASNVIAPAIAGNNDARMKFLEEKFAAILMNAYADKAAPSIDKILSRLSEFLTSVLEDKSQEAFIGVDFSKIEISLKTLSKHRHPVPKPEPAAWMTAKPQVIKIDEPVRGPQISKTEFVMPTKQPLDIKNVVIPKAQPGTPATPAGSHGVAKTEFEMPTEQKIDLSIIKMPEPQQSTKIKIKIKPPLTKQPAQKELRSMIVRKPETPNDSTFKSMASTPKHESPEKKNENTEPKIPGPGGRKPG